MLQELIDKLESEKQYLHDFTKGGINLAIELIKQHESKFEEDIKKAYDSGYSDGVYENGFNGDAQDYFNKNYKP